ncbi:leucine-rich repeat protein [Perkinsela sp. CCAP 1560/4]|nr:leucine-rich repeat protein [Perkinsela sp. CCAP 1560/4]|eukprot:KNH04118.1 leucine-rich repeat protein [Perkinsela sp. CCAP 1560/4]
MQDMFLYYTVDAHAARVDFDSLPDQMLMEMVIGDLAGSIFRDESGNFFPIDQWQRVHLESGKVREVRWGACWLRGEVHFEWLPRSVQIFEGEGNQLTGEANLSNLYRTSLTVFMLNRNQLTGSVDLSNLPGGLTQFGLSENAFCCTVEAKYLPDSIKEINLGSNRFFGTVDFTRLPRCVEWLNLMENDFTGHVNLKDLPEGLETLYLNQNHFEGGLNVTSLPDSTLWIDLSCNKLAGDVVTPVNFHYNFTRLELGGNGKLRTIGIDGDFVENDRVLL